MWHWTQKVALYRSKPKHDKTSRLHVRALFDIHPEGKLQREIKDILDELDIMINITQRQKELIKRFCRHVESILDPEGRWTHGTEEYSLAPVDDDETEGEASTISKGNSAVFDAAPQNGTENGTREAKTKREAKERAKKEKMRDGSRRKEHLGWFRVQAQDLLSEIGDRIDEFEGLKESAKSTEQSVSAMKSRESGLRRVMLTLGKVNDLLSLKHQQASAWESVNQAEEAASQTRSIMMFTVITVVFVSH
jgi:hypothetical protein